MKRSSEYKTQDISIDIQLEESSLPSPRDPRLESGTLYCILFMMRIPSSTATLVSVEVWNLNITVSVSTVRLSYVFRGFPVIRLL